MAAYGAARPVRRTVAVVLTTLLVLDVVWMVVLVLRVSAAEGSLSLVLGGMWGLVLGWAAVVAWRWDGRGRHERGEVPPLEGTLEEPEPRRHPGFTGEIDPPRRW